MSDDGTRFTAISDRGHLVRGTFRRGTQKITAVESTALEPLSGPDGALLGDLERDAEGLAEAKDGTLYISFEGAAPKLLAYRDGTARALPIPPDFIPQGGNSGFEPLAIDADGRLYCSRNAPGN